MVTMFVIDLERRICIARGSNFEVLAKFADRKSASSYTGGIIVRNGGVTLTEFYQQISRRLRHQFGRGVRRSGQDSGV